MLILNLLALLACAAVPLGLICLGTWYNEYGDENGR